jgi:hypothetical protein
MMRAMNMPFPDIGAAAAMAMNMVDTTKEQWTVDSEQ